jgi:UDPglucose 6-dehydrogenase
VNVCVYGLWHLGSVTAACLAQAGWNVTGLDESADVIRNSSEGRAPLMEPGLNELLSEGIAAGRLRFTTDASSALRGASVVWVTFDTPVSQQDVADVDYVVSRVAALLPIMDSGTLVVVSSQLPVGSIRKLELLGGRKDLSFASLPENLRLGKAIDVFNNPDRIIAGVRSEKDRERIASLLAPITSRIEWMTVESAEMTKHAINAFLATSVTFINEIATICEDVGADAKEVERGLKSESRIGPKAYLSPGAAFAGGTLARDIAFLTELGERAGSRPALIASVRVSNETHKRWARRKLQVLLGDLKGRSVGVWGLTYKAGTDTLRRSSAIELCRWLHEQGVTVIAHDPAVTSLPDDLVASINLCSSPLEAASHVDALVVATEWPLYRDVNLDTVADLVVLDPNRFLQATLEGNPKIRYVTIGKGTS